MAEYNENEYFVEEQNDAVGRETLEQVRDTSHTEIHRIHTGSTDGTLEEADTDPKKQSSWRRFAMVVKSVATGGILLHNEAKKIYNLFVLLGAIFLASILAIFAHLQVDLQWNKLQKEVEFLRDRATRTSEIRVEHTSHSAILRKLKERNINIDDPKTTPTRLK